MKFMWSPHLIPGRKILVVNVDVFAIASADLSRIEFAVYDFQGVVGPEARRAVRNDLGKQLYKEIVGLRDMAAAVGGDVDDELGLAVISALLEEVEADWLDLFFSLGLVR